jgi:hypothetical protein
LGWGIVWALSFPVVISNFGGDRRVRSILVTETFPMRRGIGLANLSVLCSVDNRKLFSPKSGSPYPSRQTHPSYIFGSG